MSTFPLFFLESAKISSKSWSLSEILQGKIESHSLSGHVLACSLLTMDVSTNQVGLSLYSFKQVIRKHHKFNIMRKNINIRAYVLTIATKFVFSQMHSEECLN